MKNMNLRKCPWCDTESTFIGRHIKSHHNKTKEDYYMYINNLDEMPKCGYSKCENKVKLRANSLSETDKTCCRNHAGLYEVENNISPLTSNNRPLDENGKDIYSTNAALTSIKNGTHALIKSNRKKDPITGKDIISTKTFLSQIKNGTFNFSRENRYNELGQDKFLWSYIKNSSYGSCISTWSRSINEFAYLYIIISKDLGKLKIGVTRNPKNRIGTFKYLGINIDELYMIKYKESDIAKYEAELHLRYIDNLNVLNIKDNKNYKLLGYTEWFSITILDDLIKSLNLISCNIKSDVLTTTENI